MATIVYQVNPKTGVKYAYSSESYWDKDKKAPRSKRTYLGRVDEESGEIIKAKKGKKPAGAAPGTEALEEELRLKDQAIERLEEEKRRLEEQLGSALRLLREIGRMTSPYSTQGGALDSPGT